MMVIVYSAYILIIAFTIWMAVDAAKQDRFWWVVLTIGVPVIGPAVYYYTEKKHEYAKVPSHHIHESETEIQHEATPKHHDRKEEKHVVQEDVKVEVQAEEKQKEKVDKKEETVNEENK